MVNPQLFDDIARGLRALIPEDAQRLREDFDRNLAALLRAALERMDLVSREEFDLQAELLARSRQRLEALERRVEALERADRQGADDHQD